jgi:hypothetical protein
MIDKRRSYIVVLDTETCPLDKDFDGVTPWNMFVYDIGWAVVDKKGNVYETKSYVNRDIFFEEKLLMNSSYYADKLPQYYDDIRSGKRKVATWRRIKKDLADTMKKYDTNIVCAHNARFDDGATKNTERWLTKSKYRYFLPYGTEIWDTMKMAQDVVAKTPTYRQFCFENGFVTSHKTPRPQVKAETLYRYITQDLDFEESHTGLEDVLIEKEILAYCFRKHKKMRKKLYESA